MTKLRKQRRRKVYKHNVNRKRLRNKICNTGNIDCKEVKNAWDSKKSVETNLSQMGLSYDPNKSISIPNRKKTLKLSIVSNVGSEWHEEILDDNKEDERQANSEPSKKFVAEVLEKDARAPRKKRFRLPKQQVEWITYLIKKYGRNYKAMSRDSKNYYQETWKQLRQKVRTLKKIPEQYSKFLEENNLQPDFSESDISDDDI